MNIILLKSEVLSLLRSRWLLLYFVVLFALSSGIAFLGGDSRKIFLSHVNIILALVPLVSILLSCLYWHQAEKFTQWVLTFPVKRSEVLLVRLVSLCLCLVVCLVFGLTVPLLLNQVALFEIMLILVYGIWLTLVGVGLGVTLGASIQDRLWATGTALVVWFYFSTLHDGVAFMFMMTFREYPLEYPVLILLGINPISLARLGIVFASDQSALLGYTGIVLKRFLESYTGLIWVLFGLSFWTLIPPVLTLRVFSKKDL